MSRIVCQTPCGSGWATKSSKGYRIMSKRSPGALLTLCLLLVPVLSAQALVGAIYGTITDSSGAVVPNAAINISDKATSATRNAVANAEGLYSAAALPPGEYTVKAEGPGFRTTQRDAQVVAGSTTNVDMTLTVG